MFDRNQPPVYRDRAGRNVAELFAVSDLEEIVGVFAAAVNFPSACKMQRIGSGIRAGRAVNVGRGDASGIVAPFADQIGNGELARRFRDDEIAVAVERDG